MAKKSIKKTTSKEKESPKHMGGFMSIMSMRPPSPTINKKNIDALETLIADPGFKLMLPGEAETMIKAFKAGQNSKKESK